MSNTTDYDIFLNQIEHYKNFPAMKPYIGSSYGKTTFPKILLIGESNYLPKNSSISVNADKWYKSNQTNLTQEEINWIHCRQLLECSWKSKGHMIYRELENNIRRHIKASDGKRAITNLAYINGFQRPSPETGGSISKFITEIDCIISSQVLSQVISIIEPDAIIFVSKLSYDKLRWKMKFDQKIKTNFTCHPGTGGRFWHNKKYNHGKNKFNEILNFLVKESE